MGELNQLKTAMKMDSSLNYENYSSPYEMWRAVLDRIEEMEK